MRLVAVAVTALLAAGCAADAPPAAPGPSPAPLAKKLKRPETASRPALRRQPDVLRNHGGNDEAVIDEDDDTAVAADADVEEISGTPTAPGFWRKYGVLLVMLVIRIGLGFLKAYYRSKGEGGAAGQTPLGGIGDAFQRSPVGALFAVVQKQWGALAAWARSPQAAPVVMGLLILSTKLVARMDNDNDSDSSVAEAATGEAAEPEAVTEVATEVATEVEAEEEEEEAPEEESDDAAAAEDDSDDEAD